MYKKILIFLIILSFWFLSGIFFPIDSGFYQSLVLPIYTPSKYLFGCIWPLLYILISFSIYKIINNDNLNSDYIFILFLNYLFNQLYSMFFFYFNSLFLSLICIIVCLVTSIILFLETFKIDKKSSYILLPYLLWNSFATILYINLYLLN